MKSLKINFLGTEYIVKTDADEDYVRRLSTYLEDKVRSSGKLPPNLRVPLPIFLASLRIADELFSVKSEFEEFKRSAEEKTRRLVDLVDRALEEPRDSENRSYESPEDSSDEPGPGTFEEWS